MKNLDFKVWLRPHQWDPEKGVGLMTTGLPLGGWDLWWINLDVDNKNNSLDGEFKVGKDIDILQFTGRLDIKGNKIFDRDILKCVSKNEFSKGEVSFKKVIRGDTWWHIEGTYFNLSELLEFGDCEIVGNSFENPDFNKL